MLAACDTRLARAQFIVIMRSACVHACPIACKNQKSTMCSLQIYQAEPSSWPVSSRRDSPDENTQTEIVTQQCIG